jgi:transposase
MGTEKARERAAVFLKVRSGSMTVAEGAAALGISRKAWYKWEARALEALSSALEDRNAGRPAAEADPQEALKEEIRKLEEENELLRLRLQLREEMAGVPDKKKQHRKSRHDTADRAKCSGETSGKQTSGVPDAGSSGDECGPLGGEGDAAGGACPEAGAAESSPS